MEEVYAQKWHQKYTNASQTAAAKMLPFLFEAFEPKSYLELGAGYGHWCRVAIDSGIIDSLAIDGPWTDLTSLQVDSSKFLIKDLGEQFELGRRFDFALTLEVAEHISKEKANTFLDNLTRHSDLIVFGAAVPLQGGYRHINEQWPSYWQNLLQEKDYLPFDLIRPTFWNDKSIPYYYRQNPIIYIKSSRVDLVKRAVKLKVPCLNMMDVIHPEKYTEMVTYESLNVPRVLRKLPYHIAKYFGHAMMAWLKDMKHRVI